MTGRDNSKTLPKVEMTSDHESIQTQSASLPISLLYRGYEIALGREADGWWARIDTLSVDTMLHSEQEAAFAEAKAFVDGFLKTGQSVTKVNSVAQVLCGRAAVGWPGPMGWASPATSHRARSELQ